MGTDLGILHDQATLNGGKPREIISVYTEKRTMSCSHCTDDCSMHVKFDALRRDWMIQGRVR